MEQWQPESRAEDEMSFEAQIPPNISGDERSHPDTLKPGTTGFTAFSFICTSNSRERENVILNVCF